MLLQPSGDIPEPYHSSAGRIVFGNDTYRARSTEADCASLCVSTVCVMLQVARIHIDIGYGCNLLSFRIYLDQP
jgi:hypothetical protein